MLRESLKEYQKISNQVDLPSVCAQYRQGETLYPFLNQAQYRQGETLCPFLSWAPLPYSRATDSLPKCGFSGIHGRGYFELCRFSFLVFGDQTCGKCLFMFETVSCLTHAGLECPVAKGSLEHLSSMRLDTPPVSGY